MKNKIVTRFAPSPTGFLHVGGARTAIFNYLFARKQQGVFRLRIEDTDRNRSSNEMVRKIVEGLKWLGVEYDGKIVFQRENVQRHREAAGELLETGNAYRCFCSKEELEEKRRVAELRGETYRYDQNCRRLSETEVEAKLEREESFVVRFRVPEGKTGWQDGVRGRISVQNRELDDFIVLRSDGSPTYQLSVVADDFEMGITHVIRGEDHISNTPKQILIYHALGWETPEFVHVPLILGPDKKRLSKRHGASSVQEYQEAGILPEALFNYLSLLGWTPPEETEILSPRELIAGFSISGINKKSAIFDPAKLRWMNRQYISQKKDKALFPEVTNLWVAAGLIPEEQTALKKEKLLKIISLLKFRVENMNDFVDSGRYFFRDPESYQEKGIRKHLKNPDVWNWLTRVAGRLEQLPTFGQTEIEKVVRDFAGKEGVSAARIIHPVRLALCGLTASPGLFELMEMLGKETVIRRLNRFLEKRSYFDQVLHKEQE